MKYKGMALPWPDKAIDVRDKQDGCMTQAVYVTRMGVFLSPEDYELAAKCVNAMNHQRLANK